MADALPAGFAYVSSMGDGMHNSSNDVWTVAMTTSNQVQLTITAQAVATGSYYNTATITGWPPGVTDPNPSNDTASVSVVVTPPATVTDFGIYQYASNSNTVAVGQTIEFYLTLANLGPATVTGTATVADALPAGFAYVSRYGRRVLQFLQRRLDGGDDDVQPGATDDHGAGRRHRLILQHRDHHRLAAGRDGPQSEQ